jgi:hypothetical protein
MRYTAAAVGAFLVGTASVVATTAVAGLFTTLSATGSAVLDTETVPRKPVESARDEIAASIEPVAVNENDEAEQAEPEQTFVPEGWFYADEEEMPEAFRDIDHIEIMLFDYEKVDADGNHGVGIPPKGSLQAKKVFRFSRIAIFDRKITFQTNTVGGVSYRFTGEFWSGDSCELNGPTPDLTGELIKIKDGKWAAAMKANLYQGCGC